MNISYQIKNMLYLVFKYNIYIIINNMTEEDIDRTLDDDDDDIIDVKKTEFEQNFGNMNNLSVNEIKKKLKSLPKKDLLKYMDKFKDMLETEKKDMSGSDVKTRLQMKLKELKLSRSSKQILNNVKKIEETLKTDDANIVDKIADLSIKSKSQKKRLKKKAKKNTVAELELKPELKTELKAELDVLQ
jgi:hypothetical protein